MPADRSTAELSPLRLLDGIDGGPPAPSELAVLMAPAGVGKSSCLVQMALDYLLNGRAVAHIVLDQPLHRVTRWYDHGLTELAAAVGVEVDAINAVERVSEQRNIVAFAAGTFTTEVLRSRLEVLFPEPARRPEIVIIDGYPIHKAKAEEIDEIKQISTDLGVMVWVSALGKGSSLKKGKTPAALSHLVSAADFMLRIKAGDGISKLQLLKSRDTAYTKPLKIKLNPRTLLREKS
ncbi:MAG: hypothetical protein ACE366_06010 [Bradymonadia bacterium]